MWLINATTYLLEEFVPEQCPPFAILSHRWEAQEVSFKDTADLAKAQFKKGYQKVAKTCQLAKNAGLHYAWVDTCCINKESSAELSEAINLMFEWYRMAQVCYVYLSDVEACPLQMEEFRQSAWFTRGWTLQELIAPRKLIFFNSTWEQLGRRSDLIFSLEEVTGIDAAALNGVNLAHFSAATRMSWASKRVTTRREDLAYCLLGIFEINMPLIYGEGDRAFRRLQEEIIRCSDDLSIFMWQQTLPGFSGLLAPSPRCFADLPVKFRRDHISRSSFTMTNRGIAIDLPLRPWIRRIHIFLPDFRDGATRLPIMPIFLTPVPPGQSKFWVRLHDPTLNDKALRTRFSVRLWLHRIAVQPPRVCSIIVKEVLDAQWDVPALSRHEMPFSRYGFHLQHTESINRLFKTVTIASSISEAGREGFPFDHFNLDSAFAGDQIMNAILDPGEWGIALMLEARDSVTGFRRCGFGYDFDGIPFFVATTRSSLPLHNLSDTVHSHFQAHPGAVDMLDFRTAYIDLLIQGEDQGSAPAISYVSRTNHLRPGWKWVEKLSVAGFRPAHTRPSTEGIWAFKGFEWNVIIRLKANDEDESSANAVNVSLKRTFADAKCLYEISFQTWDNEKGLFV